jgi:hypothetical protein
LILFITFLCVLNGLCDRALLFRFERVLLLIPNFFVFDDVKDRIFSRSSLESFKLRSRLGSLKSNSLDLRRRYLASSFIFNCIIISQQYFFPLYLTFEAKHNRSSSRIFFFSISNLLMYLSTSLLFIPMI